MKHASCVEVAGLGTAPREYDAVTRMSELASRAERRNLEAKRMVTSEVRGICGEPADPEDTAGACAQGGGNTRARRRAPTPRGTRAPAVQYVALRSNTPRMGWGIDRRRGHARSIEIGVELVPSPDLT